jgi:DNA-binding CsgD family transcriptional regulator
LHALAEEAARSGANVLRASGYDDEVKIPFGVFDELVAPDDGVHQPGRAPADAGAQLVAVCRASAPPTVVIIDDAHWADGSSLSALTFALRRLGEAGVLAILACPAEEGSRLPAGLLKLLEPDGQTLRLGGLDAEALGRLLTPSWGRLAPGQLARVHAHTGGHPLHALTLAQDLDVGQVSSDLGRPLPAPKSVASLVLARVASLPGDTQALVVAAAVLGSPCSLKVAGSMSGIDDAEAVLEPAIAAEILERDGSAGLRFCHSMARSAVYLDLGAERALQLHRGAAELTEGREALRHGLRGVGAEGDLVLADQAEEVAESLVRGGSWFEAAEWLEAAAAVSVTGPAAERRRLRAAMFRYYEGGAAPVSTDDPLDVRTEHPLRLFLGGMVAAAESRFGDAERLLRAAWDSIDPAIDIDTASRIALRLSDCQQGQMRPDEALLWATRAVEVLPPGYDLVGEDPLTDLAYAHLVAGQADEAVKLVTDRVPPGNRGSVPGLLARGVVHLFTDKLGSAREDLSNAADCYLRAGPLHKFVEAECVLVEAEHRMGLWDHSLRHAEEAIAAAERREMQQLLALALAVAVSVPAARGDWARAEWAIAGALEALAQRGSLQALGMTWIGCARLETARDNPQGVIDALSTIASFSNAIPMVEDELMVPWRSLYGSALVRLGRVDEAARHADQLSAFALARRARSAQGAAARLRGLVAGGRDEPEVAVAALTDAVELYGAVPMPFEAAQAQLDLGRELRRAGRRTDAATQLEAARAVFARLGATPFAERCSTELASCGLRRRPVSPGGTEEALTAAEEAAAVLVADGATNRQVAENLHLSVRTVEHHLRQVYAKLGVTSRSQLASRREEFFGRNPSS